MISARARLAVIVGALLSTAAAGAQVPLFRNPALPATQRIANLLSLMTVDEKIDALGMNSGVARLGVPARAGDEGHGVAVSFAVTGSAGGGR